MLEYDEERKVLIPSMTWRGFCAVEAESKYTRSGCVSNIGKSFLYDCIVRVMQRSKCVVGLRVTDTGYLTYSHPVAKNN